jgi:hypothetical protein
MCLIWSPTTWSRPARPADEQHGTAIPLAAHERSGILAAASHARRAVPGPLGELAARELSAYADLGYRGSPDALVPQLARQVLALPALTVPAGPSDRPAMATVVGP